MKQVTELTLATIPVQNSLGPGVDEKNKRLNGAKVLQLGPLNDERGEYLFVDETSLKQIVQLGDAPNKGTRVRFNHPQPGEDMSKKHLGRAKNFRVEGDVVRADIWLAEAAFSELSRNVGGYVLQLVSEDGEALGLSIHSVLDIVSMRDAEDEDGRLPLRFKSLTAVDVVDQPAATRGGMFSKEFEMSEELKEELIAGAAEGPGKPVLEEKPVAEAPVVEAVEEAALVEEQPEAAGEAVEDCEAACSNSDEKKSFKASQEAEENSLLAQAQPYIDSFGEDAGSALFLKGVDYTTALQQHHAEALTRVAELEEQCSELLAKLDAVEGVVESFEEVQTEISANLSTESAVVDAEMQQRELKLAEARKQGLSPGAAGFAALFGSNH